MWVGNQQSGSRGIASLLTRAECAKFGFSFDLTGVSVLMPVNTCFDTAHSTTHSGAMVYICWYKKLLLKVNSFYH